MTERITKRLPLSPTANPTGPTYAVWELTLKCNQKCRFCGTRAGHPRENELTTDEALSVVRQLAEMGAREVSLHGGEAYLRPDWLEIVGAIRAHGMDPTMVIGGRGFTAEMARAGKQAGLEAVSVSIDGVQALHDELRGVSGSHAAAVAALEHLLDAGIAAGCNTQLNQQNFRELAPLVEVLGQYPLYGWQVQLMVPMGRAADSADLWLQPYDLLELLPAVARMRVECDRLGIKLWAGDNVGYFGPFEHTVRYQRSRSGHCGGCGGGVLAIGIEAHGDIKGCSAMGSTGYIGGNVREQTLQEVWDHAPELHHIRRFRLDSLWGFCRTCYYAEVCRAGCIWTASTILGRHGNNPYCHHRALELLDKGQRERLVLVEAAKGEIRDRGRFELVTEPAPEDWAEQMRAIGRTALAEVTATAS